jgi:hypothetical protein
MYEVNLLHGILRKVTTITVKLSAMTILRSISMQLFSR